LGLGLAFLALLLIPLLTQIKGMLFLTAAAVGGIGAIWVMRRPYVGVLGILAAIVIDIDPIGIPFLGIPYLLSMVLLVPLTLTIVRHREVWVWRVPHIRIQCLIGILFLVSLGWNYYNSMPLTDNSVRMFTIFISRLGFMVFFLYFANTREKNRVERLAYPCPHCHHRRHSLGSLHHEKCKSRPFRGGPRPRRL